jgi:hypothetical protein
MRIFATVFCGLFIVAALVVPTMQTFRFWRHKRSIERAIRRIRKPTAPRNEP